MTEKRKMISYVQAQFRLALLLVDDAQSKINLIGLFEIWREPLQCRIGGLNPNKSQTHWDPS